MTEELSFEPIWLIEERKTAQEGAGNDEFPAKGTLNLNGDNENVHVARHVSDAQFGAK